ncbi:hypothetical protein [Lysinibacillus sphaericus]|uniref:hypothetical protein n=1 Tax=Lysinibacillus sphaericus TaxID=1421 RepID=UPI001A9E559A|nr:hypothetical protein [Lysinibacillus sphaericus]QTB26290.1 hypothetical protein J2D51_18890 [Lysinibacillus sphaericus]
MLQVYLLYFDSEIMKIQAEILQLHNETSDTLDMELKKTLQADGYDFYDYSDEISILVDNQGLFKPNNPVFEIVSEFSDRTQLAGRLLFVRNFENEFSVDIGSIKYEDIFNLRTNLQIQLIGVTKGE